MNRIFFVCPIVFIRPWQDVEFFYFFLPPEWRYTTHKQQTVKICYFLHPLHLRDVEILKELNFGFEKVYLIKLFDNSETHLPAWMTDPEYCDLCRVQDKGECSLSALRELRKFLNCLDM